MEEGVHRGECVVKVLVRICPDAALVKTVLLGVDEIHVDFARAGILVLVPRLCAFCQSFPGILASIEGSLEEVDAHDGEYQNKERANQQNIGHGGHRSRKSIGNEFHALVLLDDLQRSEAT